MKDIKHIRRDFHSVAWVMPQGLDFGGTGWVGGGQKNIFFPKFSQIWCLSDSHEWHMQGTIFLVPTPWDSEEGPKGQISFNFNY